MADDSLVFGRIVNIGDKDLLIGSPTVNNEKGTVYHYTLKDDIWQFKGEIKPPAQDTFYSFFGSSIDREGETVIVGAERDKTYSYAPGAVYIFQIPARDTVEVTICKGDSYPFGDSTIYTEGHYVDTLVASYGVDSIVQLYLKVLPTDNNVFDTLICDGESINLGDSIFTESGNYQVHLQNQFGCDSLINLSITIPDIKIDTVQISNDFGCAVGKINIKLNEEYAPYAFDWGNGIIGNPIASLSSGDYTVTITDNNNCAYQKDFYIPDSISYLIPNAFFPSAQDNDINKRFKIYTSNEVNIISTEIYNRWGEKVFFSDDGTSWDGTFRGKPQSPGVYLYKIMINSPCGTETKTGQLILLR